MPYKDKAKQNEACRLAMQRMKQRRKEQGLIPKLMWIKDPNAQKENRVAQQDTADQDTPVMSTETNSLNPKGNTKKVTHEYSC